MLCFVSHSVEPPALIYVGKDKTENELLIEYAWHKSDIWFHVDKLSSAHVYLRLAVEVESNTTESASTASSSVESGSTQKSIPKLKKVPPRWTLDSIPDALLVDLCQLVKANSIQGNKKDNLTIIYTPCENLRKTGDMAEGQVGFVQDKQVRRKHIETRVNAIINRLQKTKWECAPDFALERQEYLKYAKNGFVVESPKLSPKAKRIAKKSAKESESDKELDRYGGVLKDETHMRSNSDNKGMDFAAYEDNFM